MSSFPFIAAPIPEAAKSVGFSVSTLREAIDNGELEVHYGGRRATKPVIRAVDLDEWVASLPTERG